MKSVMKYLVIILLLAAALPLMVYVGSSNVTAVEASATPTPTPSNYTIPTFSSFFQPIFGIRLFPGADPVGTYTINVPTPPTAGVVRGHLTNYRLGFIPNHATVYLSEPMLVRSNFVNLGSPVIIHKPVGSYITTTDANGYYEIDNVTFGNYDVYYTYNFKELSKTPEMYAGSVSLTVDAPYATVDLRAET